MNPYTNACKEIETILLGLDDTELVHIMESVDWHSNKFDGLFKTMTIGELVESGRDTVEVVDACLEIGATDYENVVRYDINGGWKSGKIADMVDDAKLWAGDAAEWMLDNIDTEPVWWPNDSTKALVDSIIDAYWDSVDEEPAA